MSDPAKVDPDAVVRLGVDLKDFVRVGDEVRAVAASAAAGVRREIEIELARRQVDLRYAEDAYSACMRMEDADCSAERQAVRKATERVQVATTCLRRMHSAQNQFDESSARYRSDVERVNDQAQRRLTQIASDLGIYQQFGLSTATGSGYSVSFGGGGRGRSSGASGGSSWSGGGAGSLTGNGSHSGAGIPDGYALVPLSMIDDSDSRVSGPADFKRDTSPEDLAWGFEALQNVILPAMARGKGIDYFRDRDNREGRMGSQSYADTYSGFFGTSEAPRFTRQPDGSLRVANGFHRVWVARNLGLEFIPGQVVD
ncbi:hypothetical protein [Rhodococcus pyridinivorans]